MRKKTIQITMINNSVWFVDPDELNSFGVPDNPVSFIGNQIKGSGGPMLKVNSTEDLTGETRYVNPRMIVDMKITYPNG